MPGQSHVTMPCGRRNWCGRVRCRYTDPCPASAFTREDGAQSAPHAVQEPPRGGPPAAKKAARPLAAPADVEFVYDGSLAGFYCCVHESVYSHRLPGSIQTEGTAQPTLYPQLWVETIPEKAEKVQASIPKKLGGAAAELVQAVFLSCLAEKELNLLRFLLFAYRQGPSALDMAGHPDVAPVLAAQKHLGGEVHLLKGFIRFSDYDGVLAATISPKNFVLPYLQPHFVGRYSQERFLVYDKTHKAALVYEAGLASIVPLEGIEFPQADEAEQKYRALWKRFYNTISIKARENPRCRMTHMPKRYWENMLEVADLLTDSPMTAAIDRAKQKPPGQNL